MSVYFYRILLIVIFGLGVFVVGVQVGMKEVRGAELGDVVDASNTPKPKMTINNIL